MGGTLWRNGTIHRKRDVLIIHSFNHSFRPIMAHDVPVPHAC
jgi:hypothetical protein